MYITLKFLNPLSCIVGCIINMWTPLVKMWCLIQTFTLALETSFEGCQKNLHDRSFTFMLHVVHESQYDMFFFFFFGKVSWSKVMQIFFLPQYIQRSSTHASIWVKKTSILNMFINCWPPQHFALVDTTRKLTNKLINSNDDVTIRIGIREIIISSCCVAYYHWNKFWLFGIYLNNLMN
jgi:hypothetical protein